MSKASVCIVVPAYNEAKVIASSLTALKRVINPEDIYIVSDGSSDGTGTIARRVLPNVVELGHNFGKARALDFLIRFFSLTKRYTYILFSDADSLLAPNFIQEINKYVKTNPACIVGTVTSDRHGLISAYRTYEYGITHKVFKRAQDIMKVITVAPGCASFYRSDILEKLDFSRHTLTEDMDLTLQIHEKKLGTIVYAPKAKVITQDPENLRDYWKQIMRWYTGFWQNFFLHKVYKPNRRVNFELYFLILDSLAWIASLVLAGLHPTIFAELLGLSCLMVIVFASIIIIMERAWWTFLYLPLFPLFQYVNVAAYSISFFRAIFNSGKTLSWHKVNRYSLQAS